MKNFDQRLCDVLDICHTAHKLGQEEYGTYRVKREWPGALPKRKGLTKNYIKRILKAHDYEIGGTLSLSEERMLLSAYDQGLLTKHIKEDEEYYGAPIPLKVQPKRKSRYF